MKNQEFKMLTDKFQSPDALLDAYHDGEIDRDVVIDALNYSMCDYHEDDLTGFISLGSV